MNLGSTQFFCQTEPKTQALPLPLFSSFPTTVGSEIKICIHERL